MIDILLLVILFLAFLQPTKHRMLAATTYGGLCAIHNVFSITLEGGAYYISAGFFDLVILAVLCSYGAINKLTDDLISICIASLVINAYGWLIWFNYLPPVSYNIASMALYLIAILVLTQKETSHGQFHQRHTIVRAIYNKGVAFCRSLQEEARN